MTFITWYYHWYSDIVVFVTVLLSVLVSVSVFTSAADIIVRIEFELVVAYRIAAL